MLSVLLGVVGHGRLRVYIIDARDGINEVVVSSKRVPDQFLHEDAGDVVPFCLLQGGTEQQMQCRGAITVMKRVLALSVACVLGTAGSALAQSSESEREAVFEQNCAVCHNNPATRAPARASLHAMSPNFIVQALTNGIMKPQGSVLSPEQRVLLAEFLTGRKVGAEAPMAGRCHGVLPFSLDGPSFNGWGANVENWRFQPEPGLSAAQLARLDLKWAFGIPGVVAMFGQPTIAGGRVFVGGQNGHVYSLDMQSGCYYWDYTASAGVRTAITVARVGNRNVAVFGDRRGHAYSVDAATGETIWIVIADDATAAQITGAPVLFQGRIYVPISVGDDSAAIDPKYPCCQGRGAIVALDATNGDEIWKTYSARGAHART